MTANKGTLSVLPRTPEFVDSKNLYTTRVYDGRAVDLTPTTDGDGTVSRVITNRETNEVLTSDPVDVGEYRVVYSVSEGKNYTEGSVSYDFAITQAPLVITAEDKNVVFGAKAPEYTVVYDGFVNGEMEAVLTGTLVVTCDYTVESRESAYEIVPSGLSAKNYAITWKNGVLTARYPESDSDDYEETSKPANSKMPESGTNNPGQGATAKDAKKGYVNENSGIVSGKTLTEEMLKNDNGSLNDGYSHWIQTNAGWWFRYADGSYPKAAGAVNSGSGNSSAAQSYEWVQIDGSWWSFDTDGYLATGWIYDPEGIKLDIVKDIKEVKRGRIKEYADRVEGATYTEGKGIWNIKCDIYLPCATQNELDLDAVKILIANGCKYVAEGANMPTTREATDYLMANGVTFMPGKAANAGGVATSALEMCQNSARLSWTAEEVDTKLHQIMVDIFHKVDDASKRYDMEGNYVAGANIAGFEKVVDAMIAQGIV